MSETVKLTAGDGHELDGYVSRPVGAAIGGLVVVQEAFGVNGHIRSVADGYAHDGFLAIAPAMFDRVERGVELGYAGDDLQKGIALARQVNPDDAVKDMAAAFEYLRGQGVAKCGVIGYCFGGTMAWLAATRLDPQAAVGYYGGNITRFAQENPACPVMLHFGSLDKHIPKMALTNYKLRIRMCKCSGMTPTTGSTATIAPPTTRLRRSWRGNDRWLF